MTRAEALIVIAAVALMGTGLYKLAHTGSPQVSPCQQATVAPQVPHVVKPQ